MGKYAPSNLNNKYSDWHWRDTRFNRDDFLTDIDRIWVEVRGENPIAAFDIKEPTAETTPMESKVYNWLENKGLPVFIVSTTQVLENFRVTRWKTNATRKFNQEQYIYFINNLKDSLF
jgi:hypothetical protein